MPVKVVKRSGKKPWKIIEISTGKIVGSSDSEIRARISASYRNQAYKEKIK